MRADRPAAETCRAIARRSGSSFYYPLLLLPGSKRRALMAIYAFCRRADDLVDSPAGLSPPADGIREWREELRRCYAGVPRDPITRALRDAVERYRIPIGPFEDLLDGMEMDLTVRRYATFEDLRVYCRRVASTVGLMCIEVFGYRDPGSREYAGDLGVALQLTNILRDLRRDAARGRIYVPQEDMRRFGCDEVEILEGRPGPGFLDLLRFESERARAYYRRAWLEMPAADRRSLTVAEAMGTIYYELLREIERRGRAVLRKRVSLAPWTKLRLAMGVWGRAVLGLPRPSPADPRPASPWDGLPAPTGAGLRG